MDLFQVIDNRASDMVISRLLDGTLGFRNFGVGNGEVANPSVFNDFLSESLSERYQILKDCVRGLNELGRGSSRTAYAIPRTNWVFKLARSEAGIEQNMAEVELSQKYSELFSWVVAFDTVLGGDGPIWLIVEKAETLLPTSMLFNRDVEAGKNACNKVLDKYFHNVTVDDLFALLSLIFQPNMFGAVSRDKDSAQIYDMRREFFEEGEEDYQEYLKGQSRPLPLLEKSKPLAGVIALPAKTEREDYIFDALYRSKFKDRKKNPFYGEDKQAMELMVNNPVLAQIMGYGTKEDVKNFLRMVSSAFFKKPFDIIKRDLTSLTFQVPDFGVDDLLRPDHYGVVVRQGHPHLVIIDYGYTVELAKKRYGANSVSKMGFFSNTDIQERKKLLNAQRNRDIFRGVFDDDDEDPPYSKRSDVPPDPSYGSSWG